MSITVKTAIVHGIAWLYEMEQVEGAIIGPQGLSIRVPDEQRIVSFHPIGSHDFPVMVLRTLDPEKELRRNELMSAMQWCQRLKVTVRQLWGGRSSPEGTVEFRRLAHPTLIRAARLYREGCEEHGGLPDHTSQWFTRGHALVRVPHLIASQERDL